MAIARRFSRGRQVGFTLVELMIVVAIIGVLASLAIYGMGRYLAVAKSAEAKEAVGAISRGALLAFQQELDTSQVLAEGGDSLAGKHSLCTSANPVPLALATVAGHKYQPDSAAGKDFNLGGSPFAGWACLRYSKGDPMAYQYMYWQSSGYVSPAVGGPDPGPTGYEASAQGDLNANGIPSIFAISGMLNVATGEVRSASQVFTANEYE